MTTDIDNLIAKPTDLALLPIETQRSLVSLTLSAFEEWRVLYDKYGPASRSWHLTVAYGKYQGMEKLLGYLIGHQRNIHSDMLEMWDENTNASSHLSSVDRLRKLWAGEPTS